MSLLSQIFFSIYTSTIHKYFSNISYNMNTKYIELHPYLTNAIRSTYLYTTVNT